MAFDLLPSLHPRARQAVVCVRVTRKWECRGGTDDGPIQHVDLVLIDEKGNSMYGEIPSELVPLKSLLIEEDGVYIISRFRVSNAKHNYRAVDARFMVEFTCHTRVEPARESPLDFPHYTYNLTPIDRLRSRAGDTKNFVDTIGLLVEVSESYTVQLPNKPGPTLTRNIVLRDLGYTEIKASLWGERAAAFDIDQLLGETGGKLVILLLVGCLVKKYNDAYYMSANTAARWYFNPEIPEANQFYSRFKDQLIQIKRVPAPAQEQTRTRAPSDLDFKSLHDLNEMDPYDFVEDGYRCMVSIARLVPNVSWWFASCTKCSKSCVQDGASYRCNDCSSNSYRFKYKLCFIARDGTGESEMICFGETGRKIIGKPVQQVMRAVTPGNPVPRDVTGIISQTFTFAICLTQQSYYRQQKTYQITSVLESHGQNNAPPVAPPNDNGGSPPANTGHQLPGGEAGQTTLSPISAVSTDLLPSPTIVTPPSLDVTATATVDKASEEISGSTSLTSARKRLFFDNEDELDLDPDDNENTVPEDTPAVEKKRSRRGRVAA